MQSYLDIECEKDKKYIDNFDLQIFFFSLKKHSRSRFYTFFRGKNEKNIMANFLSYICIICPR